MVDFSISKKDQEVLDEYILSVKAITSDKKKAFRKHYKKAGKLLKGIAAG